PLTVECPTCGGPVERKSDNKHLRFCSGRCKLNDVGPGAAEGHAMRGDTLGGDIFSAGLPPRDH
ncbi:DNA gyrase inhibitor YacG, partial [Pseudomonas aeruginosa]|uniref:DNA gyrase inhibitor YacG n=1 Tax=Pseudomonas aeruginosa TaxID=287 RepID=UPI0024B1697D